MAETKSVEQLLDELQTGMTDYNGKMSTDFEEFKAGQKTFNDRIDAIETKLNKAPGVVGNDKDDDIEMKWNSDFERSLWQKGYVYNELDYIKEYVATHSKQEVPEYLKTIAGNDLSSGGYWLTPTISSRIIEKILLLSPMRNICSVETLRNGDELVMLGEAGTMPAGWTSERGSRAATDNMTLTEMRIPTHPMYAMPIMTQKMARIAAFDVEGWMTRKVAKYMAYLEGVAFVTGTGAGQPEGILTAARETGTSVVTVDSGSSTTIPDFDTMIDVQETLPEQYQANACWVMNRATKAVLRKFQDGMGRYMLEENVQQQYGISSEVMGKSTDMLFGKPIVYIPAMNNVAAAISSVDQIPIAYGDFQEAYTIVDNPGIYTIRDEITTKGAVSLFTERLGVGGGVVNELGYVTLTIHT
jgi:HK97 family phage major capsid protein